VSGRAHVAVAATIASIVALSGIAVAQEPGVQVDPESPAGKEYGIPLEQARRGAGGATGGAVGNEAFGAGVTPAGDQDDPPGGASGGSTAARNGAEPASGPSGARSSAPESRRTGRDAGVPSLREPDNDSTGLLVAVIALTVIACGGALGLALKRVRVD